MKKLLIILFFAVALNHSLFAGNRDRAGQAGAYELQINPWARSSGWSGLNTANCRGIESLNQNPGGLAFAKSTELVFAHTIYLHGSDINLNAFGFAQPLGKNGGVLGADVVAMSFGEIPVTTAAQPEGGIGIYKPLFMNIAIGYAKTFSNSIHCGVVFRGINESVSDISASGISVDAGIQYVTGTGKQKDNVRFGISLRNIGTPMKFKGDALSFKATSPDAAVPYQFTVENRSQQFELPSLLNIGGAYDFKLGGGTNELRTHRITVVANFTSNSFSQDQFGGGVEYAFKEMFMIRGGYNYQKDITTKAESATAFTGLSGGFTLEVPLKKNGPSFGVDYSYRASNPWGGTHSIGVRMTL